MKKLFLFLMIFLSIINVKAYENDYFKIDIPNDYKEEISDNIYKWSTSDKYIAITISNNSSNYDIRKYSNKDLESQKKHMEDTYNKELKDYNVNVEVSNIRKEEINKFMVLLYDIYWPTKELTGNDMYQIGATYTTQDYIYTLIYNSNNKIEKDEFDKIIKSFKPKDIETYQYNHKKIYTFILFLGIILGIAGFIYDHKKKRK